jgi:microcystin degradation protein MlrC
MRVGIIGLLHESNTFIDRRTTIADFQAETLLTGEAIRQRFADAHHEIGGFFAGLATAGQRSAAAAVQAVPLLAARALPSGPIDGEAWRELIDRMLGEVAAAGPLDGLLVAPHGATVSDAASDADGDWLGRLRQAVGPATPIVGTLDLHANLTQTMVDACDALIAYRTNPHLDQRQRGVDAARLLLATLRGEVRPRMAAEFPPLAINIQRQRTADAPLREIYELADAQLDQPGCLSNSIVLGFPYADVPEMGASVIAVADGDPSLAARYAHRLAQALWSRRHELIGELISIDAALDQALQLPGPVCLLDMGDNVGGGSAADGTALAHAIHTRGIANAVVCLYDAQAVQAAEQAGIGASMELSVGGKTDTRHGTPLTARFRVVSLHDGRFHESRPRHGGITQFDQGRTAIVQTERGLTVMLTSRRMVPFSLEQLTSCGLVPERFHLLVAKGVHAPVAAYQELCRHIVQVNTPGSTCADLTQLTYERRRRPLFPLDEAAESRGIEKKQG